ncbi:MAG TPA: TonB-dependent receptor [Gemmatimonadales bacterium]|jgi:outer membrane receptor for ferrienterochelin and colicins|nr:TonB-dependent receptor [Gemmatimonadales bacterium]
MIGRPLAVLSALALAAPVAAQQTGTIVGTVHDSAGAPVAGAKVDAVGAAFTLTGAAGRFRLREIPAGTVRVRVAAFAFRPDSTQLTVPAGDSVAWEVILRPGVFYIPGVVVTAGKRPESLENVTASVEVESDSVIARHAVTTIDEAVNRVAGVQFIDGQVNIRGSSGFQQGLGARVLLLVDGVPMNEADRGGIDWDLVPVDDAERVEVVKGAGSSLYGSAALGGVVNIITRDIPEGIHGRVRFFGGGFANPPDSLWKFRSFTGMQGGGSLTGSFGTDQVRGALTVGGHHSDGYRQQDASDYLQVAGRGEWLPDPLTRVLFTGSWATNQFQEPLAWCGPNQCPNMRGLSYQPFLVDTADSGNRTRSDHGYLTATVTRTPDENTTWMARASWLRTHFTDFQRAGNDFAVADRFGAEGRIVTTPTSDQTVTVGAEATESQVTSDIFQNHTQEEFAAYGEAERVVGAARLTAGARVDLLADDGGGLSAVISPRVAAVLPTGIGIWRASVGRGFRAASLGEKYVTTPVPPFQVVPNPTLRPETAWSGELGNTAVVTSWLRTNAALFYTRASEYIAPELVGDSIQFQNVQRVTLAGLDLNVTATPFTPNLTASLSYTYLDARELATDSAPSQPLAFRPRHLLTLSADYVWGPVSVGADFRYSSRFDRVELYETDPRVAGKVLDLRAGWRLGAFDVRVLATNALNYVYNLAPRTLEPVGTVTMTVTYVY